MPAVTEKLLELKLYFYIQMTQMENVFVIISWPICLIISWFLPSVIDLHLSKYDQVGKNETHES